LLFHAPVSPVFGHYSHCLLHSQSIWLFFGSAVPGFAGRSSKSLAAKSPAEKKRSAATPASDLPIRFEPNSG
jgi:hypothetical protein